MGTDDHRIYYYSQYTNQMLKAIKLDNCNIIGYTAWSLMDNFEWGTGYDEKFGIYHVDFNDPSRKRTPKASAEWYRDLIQDNGFHSGVSSVLPINIFTILATLISI